jgi:GNAT superfamily N-acetyltransferase
MIKLNKEEYSRVLPLVREVKHNKALIYSVIEGDSDGSIYVDNAEAPKNAFIENEFTFIVGRGDNEEFNNELLNYVFKDAIPNSKDNEAILFLQTDIKQDLEKIFNEKGCIIIERKMFDFDTLSYENAKKSMVSLPDDVKLIGIDKDFVTKYKKHDEVAEKDKRFGFCSVKGDDVISECFSVVVGADEAEISIETNESYRRRGFAFATASRFIDHCIERGITPIWSCWPFRKESIALALKLGFKEDEDIPVIYWAEDL